MLRTHRSRLVAATSLVSVLGAAPLAAQQSGFEMQAYIDGPGGRDVFEGRYERRVELTLGPAPRAAEPDGARPARRNRSGAGWQSVGLGRTCC